MRRNNIVCPYEHVVLGAVVKAKKEVVNLTNPEGVVNVVYSALLVVAADILKIGLVSAEVLVEHLDAVVTVTADEGVRNDAVHKGYSLLGVNPLLIGLGLGIVLMAFVYAKLGDITKTYYVLNVLRILVVNYPLIDVLEELGILVVDGLSVTDERKAVCVFTNGLYVFLLPKELLIVSVVAVAGEVGKVGICVGGIDFISRDKLGLIKSACVVCGNLSVASYVGVEAELLNEALEVLVLSILPILTVTLCITECGISTDEELLLKRLVTVIKHVLGNGLLELAVYVATRLTASGIVNDGEMLPSAGSEVNVGESVVRGSAVCVSVREAGITLQVNLEHNARAVIAAVVADDSTADGFGVKGLRHINPSLEGLDALGESLVYLVLTEVLNLNTAAVIINEGIAVAGVVAQSSLTHSGDIVGCDQTVGA